MKIERERFAYVFPIVPEPKKRHRVRVIGKFAQTYTDPKTRAFESYISRLAAAQHKAMKAETLTGRLAVEMTFYCYERKSDIDNFAKAVLDGMQAAGNVFKDDKQFDLISARRFFVPKGQEGIEVVICGITGNGFEKKDYKSPFGG